MSNHTLMRIPAQADWLRWSFCGALALLAACGQRTDSAANDAAQPAPDAPPPAAATDETRAIAKEAYIYGFPMVDNYRVQYAYFVDRGNPEYKGGWNEVHNTARVYTPQDKAIQSPNSDTPYSSVGFDLRAEPLVVTVPKIEGKRYYSLQFVDMYTHNFAYIGSRTVGNGGTRVLLAGPEWRGEKPAGVDAVIRSETQLGMVLYRTQLFGPKDLENVKKIQAGYTVQALSAFLKQPAPPPPPPLDFIKPLTAQEERTSPKFFEVLNFLLRLSPTVPSETALMERFAQLRIGRQGDYAVDRLSPERLKAVQDGMADAWKDLAVQKARLDRGEISSGDLFGTREFLNNNYLYRMLGAVAGIYGNSRDEAVYPILALDSAGNPLDGKQAYVIRFPPGQLPPVNAFWSVTMYEMPSSLLVANPINRYLINSSMLPSLAKDADGGLTIYVQHASPGKARESNWLPAPPGPFIMAMRLYWPKEAVFNGGWKAPKVEKAQ